jgi:AcrR family transcriptional regulator
MPRPETDKGPRLLSAAVAIAREDGLAALSYSRLCEATDIARGSIAYFFPTRRDIVEAVLAHHVAVQRDEHAEVEGLPPPAVARISQHRKAFDGPGHPYAPVVEALLFGGEGADNAQAWVNAEVALMAPALGSERLGRMFVSGLLGSRVVDQETVADVLGYFEGLAGGRHG